MSLCSSCCEYFSSTNCQMFENLSVSPHPSTKFCAQWWAYDAKVWLSPGRRGVSLLSLLCFFYICPFFSKKILTTELTTL